MASLIRKQLSPTNLSPATVRYNGGTNTVQITNDGGATWQDAPAFDPRTSAVYQLTAAPTSNPKCDAAERAIDTLQDEISAFLNGTSVLQTANTLIDILLLFVVSFGIVAAVIWLVIEALLAIGTTAISLAFTNEVYANLKCLWFNAVGEDGIMTEAGLVTFQDSVEAAYPTDAVIPAVVSLLIDNFGLVHLNNAAVTRTETGDCMDCVPPCTSSLWNFQTQGLPNLSQFHLFAGDDVDMGTYGLRSACSGGYGSDISFNFTFLSPIGVAFHPTHFGIDLQFYGASTYGWFQVYGLTTNDLVPPGGSQVLLYENTTASGTQETDITGGAAYYGFQVILTTPAACGTGEAGTTEFRFEAPDLYAAGLCS